MSDTPQNNTTPEQIDEQLVAYLDGELAPEAAQRVEHLLAADEQARSRLSQLAASWDLLDQLPRATVDDLFTKTTVEMVAVAAEEELSRADEAAPAKRRRQWLEGGLALAVAAAIGFVLVAVAVPNQNDRLLEDLPVIYELGQYRPVDGIDYLKEYHQQKLFPDDLFGALFAGASAPLAPSDTASRDSASRIGASNPAEGIPESMSERRQWVESLSVPEKLALRDHFETFSRMSPQQHLSLRTLEEQLRDRPELRRVMQRYYDWRESLNFSEKDSLRELHTPKERAAKIKEFQYTQERSALRRLRDTSGRFDPKNSDDAAIVRWMRDFVGKHRDQLPPPEPRTGDESRTADQRPPGGQRGGRGGGPPGSSQLTLAYDIWWSPTATKAAPITDEDLHELVKSLSEERQDEFEWAVGENLERALLRRWIQAAVRAAAMQGGGTSGRGSRGSGFNPELAQREIEKELTAEQVKELQGLSERDRRIKLWEHIQRLYPEGLRGFSLPRPPGPGPREGRGPVEDGVPPPREGKAPPSTAQPDAA